MEKFGDGGTSKGEKGRRSLGERKWEVGDGKREEMGNGEGKMGEKRREREEVGYRKNENKKRWVYNNLLTLKKCAAWQTEKKSVNVLHACCFKG